MNQKDIDLVQELEAEEAARAEAVRMEENARLNALKAAKAADGQNRRRSGTRSGDCEVQTTQETGAFLMPVYCSTSRKPTDLRAHRLTLVKAAIVQYLRECSASQWYW
jgi:hypothetical protein